MASTVAVFETCSAPLGQRLGLWGERLSRMCGSLQLQGDTGNSIDGRIEAITLGRLKLCRIVASPHRVTLPPQWAAPDRHAVIKVLLQLRGNSVFEQDRQRLIVRPGDCIAYDVSRPHAIVNSTLTEHLVVVIPKDLAAGHDLHLTDLQSQRFSSRTGIGHVTRELVQTMLDQSGAGDSEHDGAIADLMLRSLRLSLAQTKSHSLLSAQESLLRQAHTYIDAHLREPNLDVERIAVALGCSKRYLHMAFAAAGTSVEKHIWSSRLEQCRQALLNTSGTSSLTELAFSWGFSSSSHFSRVFKRRYGFAPSALLRNLDTDRS